MNIENQPPKIHPLKGISKSKNNSLLKQSSTLSYQTYPASQPMSPRPCVALTPPILIRYIDPRIAHIFKELHTLNTHCQRIINAVPTKQEEIQAILISTKNINEQVMGMISQPNININTEYEETVEEGIEPSIQDNIQACSSEFIETFSPPNIESKFDQKCQEKIKEETVKIEPNEASVSLVKENDELKLELVQTIKKNLELTQENNQLRKLLEISQAEKQQLIDSLSGQLQRLKSTNSSVPPFTSTNK